MTTELAHTFLEGARTAIAEGGFMGQIERTTDGGMNPDDPLGPDIDPVVTVLDAMVFVDSPQTRYVNGSLETIGDGELYVDLLSIEGNTLESITFVPADGDYLIRPSGRRMVLSATDAPEVNGQVVVTISVVTG